MRKLKYLFFSTLVLLTSISTTLAITSSGQIPTNQKEFIWYKGKSCAPGSEVKYGPVSGYYSAFSSDSKKSYTYYTSPTIYTDEAYATKGCEYFTSQSENKNKNYLCTGTKQTSGYACYKEGKVTFEIDGRTYENINVDGGRMYTSESECADNCSGTCKVQKAYGFEYATEIDTGTTTNGEIAPLYGDVYSTANGNPAFCIQPAARMSCYGDNSAQYCLNSTFDLTTCNTANGYKSDYRCGLANIALHATKLKNNDNALNDEEYAIADIAMRMYAAYKGKLRGTEYASVPTQSAFNESGLKKNVFMGKYLFGLTAKRVDQDGNYLNNGLKCNTDTRNIGIMCNCDPKTGSCQYNQTTYLEALKLFKMALDTNTLDSEGNKVPDLITKNIDNTTSEIEITKPCEPGEDGCKIKISLVTADGKVVDEDDNVTCSKNICTAKITGEKTCIEKSQKYSVKVEISNIKFDGEIKEYHHCTYPNDRQIMMVLDIAAQEVTDNFTKTYEVKTTCDSCVNNSSDMKTTITSENANGTKNKSLTACDGNKNYGEGDYDGYDKITIAEPSMDSILKSCDKESFRESEFEINTGGYCQIYCRKETVIYLADKTKVFSGMQFQYKLEEKVPNSKKTDNHISSIVQVKKECTSVINYQKFESELEAKLKQVANAWTEYKKWEALRYAESYADDSSYPKVASYKPQCSANCDIGDNQSVNKACQEVSGEGAFILEWTSGKIAGTKGYGANAWCGSVPQTDIDSGGVCNPGCHFKLRWYKNGNTKYQQFTYSGNGNGSNSGKEASAQDGELYGISNRTCIARDGGYNYKTIDNGGGKCSCASSGTVNGFTEVMSLDNPYTKAKCNADYKDKKGFSAPSNSCSYQSGTEKYECGTIRRPKPCIRAVYTTKTCEGSFTGYASSSCNFTSTGSCTPGKDGDPQYVAKHLVEAAEKYYSLQNEVLQMLKNLENCNFYGNDWIAGEPSFKSYELSLTKGGTRGLVSTAQAILNAGRVVEGNYGEGGGGGGEVISIPEFDALKMSYDFTSDVKTSTALEEYNNNYAKIKLATSTNDVIKKNILASATCLTNNTCPELDVEYNDVAYGNTQRYDRTVNVVADDDIFNHYCIGDNCGLSVDQVKSNTYFIECDDTGLKPEKKTCKVITVPVSHATKAYFTSTTELMYYRPNEYYTENHTGKVIEVKSNTRVDSGKYVSLGKNVYPISNVNTGIYPISYHFTNIGSGKYYNVSKYNQTGLKLTNFDYDCAYEAYNNSNKYDCDGSSCNGNDNTCVRVVETAPNLSTTKWDKLTDKKSYGFMFKNTELSDIFKNENRKIGNNWNNEKAQIAKQEIEESASDIYTNSERLMLSVTLSTDAIKKIREYNESRETNAGGYTDDSLISCELANAIDGDGKVFKNCRSAFIDEISTGSGVLGIKSNSEIIRGGKEIGSSSKGGNN